MANRDAARQIGACADRLVRTGLLWKNNHGNISVRGDDAGEMILTGSVLEPFDPDSLTRLTIAGEVLEGTIAAMAREIVNLHGVVYRNRPDIGAVVHAHSPHATAYAVAGRELPVYTMALARLIDEPVRVSAFGPRGSEVEVDSIGQLLNDHPGMNAVLLRNHGVLAWGATLDEATRIIFALEENAEASIQASGLGGAVAIPSDLVKATKARRIEFERLGALTR
ncbi:MAG: class II aldolase/adducin family protein [Candidatus Limnocylindrales bacterium]